MVNYTLKGAVNIEKKVAITDTILRDAHQSLIATGMKTDEMLPVLERLDNVGFC